jgi:aldehyde dehydrogenase (NAD+)
MSGVDAMNESKVVEVLNKQRSYFNRGNTRNIPFRLTQLKTLKRVVLDNEKRITASLWADMRKPEFEAYTTEIGCVLCEIDRNIKDFQSWAEPVRVRTPLIHFPASSYVYPEPLGIVLIIAPWNYPFHLTVLPLVGAIAAGNCAVLKPSEVSSHTSHVIANMIRENFDPSFISVIEGDAETGRILLSQKFDHIFFTGSNNIGKLVMEAAARNLTPVTLELGGKSPCIVDKDVNVEYTARRIIWGKFMNAGQTCVAPDYVLVHKDIKIQLLECMKKCLEQFYGKEPFNSPDYARIINEKHFTRLLGLLKEGDIIIGGDTNRDELYVAPTIIDNVSLEHQIMQEEIFGPILPIMEYSNLDHAISIVNGLPKPLALYFFSRNRKNQDRIQKETSSGGLCINDTVNHMVTSLLPYGGIGASGFGNYHGKASFDTFSHRKAILRRSFLFDIKLRYPPYKGKLTFVKRVLQYFIR